MCPVTMNRTMNRTSGRSVGPARGFIVEPVGVFCFSSPSGIDSVLTIEEFMETRNARIGFVLFLVYLLLYGGFVFLSAFAPDVMELTPIAGVNLAILYGFGLIVAALILALIYGLLCSNEPGEREAGK
jgi:uncharacterized membrane protein (DUF485 family)